MVIHNLQTECSLKVAIVHTRDSKNIYICAEIASLHIDILMRVGACTMPAFGIVCFPHCQYTLFSRTADVLFFQFGLRSYWKNYNDQAYTR